MLKNYNVLGDCRDTRLKSENPSGTSSGFSMVKWLLSVCTLFCLFFAGFQASAQVVVLGTGNSTPAMNPSYPTLAAAITDVNNRTAISGAVILSVQGSETAPLGGYVLNNVAVTGGSDTNRFFIAAASGVTITAPTPQTSGNLNDAIFKIIGADFITIEGFTMNENAANTTTAAATNNMTEFGVAVLYSTATNGAQGIVIRNNTIALNRTYQNTFGIYSNSTHTAGAVTTSATATTTAGGNSNLKIFGNNISNVNNGIIVVGPTAIADAMTGVEIGGTGQGNTITNFGTTGTFSSYANVSGTVNGILIRNANGFVVSNNTITSSVGGVTAGTLNGIQQPASSNAPTATFTNNINNNTISLRSGLNSGAMNGINIPSGSASATSSLNINGNDFNTWGHTTATSSGAIQFIFNGSTHLNTTMNSNTFSNMSVNTTGSLTFISNSMTSPANGTKTVNGNTVVGSFAKTGSGGTILFYNSFSTSPATVTETNSNNNFSNLTFTGAIITGWRCADGSTSTGPRKIVSNNTFNNITNNTSGDIAGILQTGYSDPTHTGNDVSGNTITNITGAGIVVGFLSDALSQNFFNNTISGLTGGTTVSGISYAGASTQNCYKNTISNLQSNGASGTVNGIVLSAGVTFNINNNRIGDLRAPNSTSANAVRGIASTSTTSNSSINIHYNSIYLAGTGAAGFGSSGVSVAGSSTATTAALNMQNNNIVNNSVGSGSGLAVALRRSAAALDNYAAASNRNNLHASTVYTDGTTPQATLSAFQTAVGPTRDANSININPSFLSTVSGNANFLKIDTAVATQIESGGANIAGITDDFEGTIRQGNPGYPTQVNGGGTAPDIGADEFDGAPATGCSGTPAASTITGAASVCPGTGTTLSLSTVYTATGISYAWSSGTTPGGPYPTALGNGATQATGNLTANTYYIATITCANGGGTYTTAEKAVTMNALPAVVTVTGGGTSCTSAVINASNGGDGTIYFQGTTSGGTSTATASASQTVTASGTYYFRAQSALGCWGPEGSATVTIQTPAGITGTPASICQGATGTIAATATNCVGFSSIGTAIPGAWTASSPSANRPATSSNSTVCSFSAGTPRNYDAMTFQVSVSGAYTFEMDLNGAYDGMGYLVTGAFVPGSCATGTFIKGDDDSGGTTATADNEPLLTANLVTGVTYTLVSTNWDTAVLVGTYNWTVTPPSGGQILLQGPGTIEWYTAASGGSSIGSGSPFNPVGVAGSPLADTNTAGTTTFYAACASSSTCRTPVNFVINVTTTNPTTTVTSCGPYTWAVNGQVYTTSGSYTSTTNCVTDNLVLTVNPAAAQNTTTGTYYCTIQSAIDAATTLNGHTIAIQPGTYSEQVLVNKSLTINSAGPAQSTIDFTGTVTGKPTLFDVSADAVTINNIHFNVDLSKLRSAVIFSGAAIDNVVVTNNLVDAYGTPAGTYGERNAVSVNYGGYRVASGGVNSVTYTGNTVNGALPGSYFRAAIAADEIGGTISSNTATTINHDVQVRFGSNGPITVSNNTCNGGGMEIAEQNAAAGPVTVSNNTFNGVGAPNTAMLRIRNNNSGVSHTVSGNTFNNYEWAISSENMNNQTIDNNNFNTASATAHGLVINTKSISSNSNSIVQVPMGATIINNNFNGTGNAITFQNHDSDGDSYGTLTLGTAGNENDFAATLSSFVVFDAQTGTSTASTFPIYPGTGGWPTTMSCWDQNLDAQSNRFDVGAGMQLPSAMNLAQRTTLESKLTHDTDASCLGTITYFLPVHNITQNTYYSTIQSAINVANVNDVIECAEGTYNEAVTINKSLTLQGVDTNESLQVINGAGLGIASGITVNSGITNVTIKNFTVQNFTGSNPNSNAGVYCAGSNNNLVIDNVASLNNPTAAGIFASGPVDYLTVTNCTVTNHGPGARGIVIWDGLKSHITITNNIVTNNSCCGIELQDGNASAVNVSNNTIDIGSGDNAIGLIGLNPSVGPNTVSGNTITGGGRYGMEIKNPAGGVTVSNNNVSLTTQNADVRDRAGIAVFRRGVTAGNADVPNGVAVTGNTVNGYTQASVSEGFGIVIEGTNHSVTGNTVTNCEVGILQQQNPSNYPGDADQSNVADQYFGRGNSPMTCGNTISGNTFTANGTNTRNIGVGYGLVTNTNSAEAFCSIQSAINDAQTLNGHTLNVSAGTYPENVIVNKSVTISGPNAATSGCGTRVAEAIVTTATAGIDNKEIFHVAASNVTITGLTIDGDNTAITSGFTSTNGADIDAAEGITIYENNINNLTVTNNIIRNLSYFGVTLYGDTGIPTSGHVISNNSIRDLGTYDAGSGISLWGGGVLLYNNQYAAVSNNCMDNVRLGLQTGNFWQANPGAAGSISNNTMTNVRRRGIMYNLHYSAASPFIVSNNTVSGAMNAGETNWDGILVASQSVASTFTGNSVNGAAITNPSHGIVVWNVSNASPTAISGGTISNVNNGIFVNNYDGYPTSGSNAPDGGHASLSSIAISSCTTGIRVKDNTLSTHAPASLTIGSGVTVTGGTSGLVIENASATVNGSLSDMAFSGQSGQYVTLLANTNAINGTTATFGGITGGSATLSQNYAVEDKISHKIDNGALGFVTVKANNTFVTTNSFVSPATTAPAIQRGVDAASNGFTVNVAPGTFIEDVSVFKSVTVLGGGIGVTTVSGAIGGSLGSAFQLGAPNVVVEGFTITREGNNVAQWNDPNLNTGGISIQGLANNAEVRYCELTGLRTGIDINNSNGNNIHNNNIHNNRTGVILRNQTDNTVFRNNFVTNNWTAGILFLDASGGTNSPVQSAANSSFNDNNISGNWYAQVVDRQTGGALPAAGSNLKNFTCNWYGSTSPVITTANSAEPGYAAQIPVAFGGTATAPGGQPDLAGAASANINYAPLAISGTDLGGVTNDGWQPSAACAAPCDLVVTATPTAIVCNGGTSTVTVTATGGSGTYTSGIGTFTVTAGTYTYTVTDLNGCVDSETITISQPPVSAGTTTQTACDSYTWAGPLGNGTTYTVSGTYTNVTTNGSGCQHTQTLVLTINNSTTNGTMTVTNAGPYTWALPLGTGLTYTTSGVYTNTTLNAAGCPNVATLTLTVTPVNSFLIGTSCGATISGLSVTVNAPFVPGAQTYMFRITNMATNAVLNVNRPVNSLALSNYPGITLGTQYNIQVSTNGGATYSASCILTTPSPVSTIGAQCGTTLTSMGQFVYATYAPNATGYRFRVTNLTTNTNQVVDGAAGQNRFTFTQLPAAFVTFSTTYSVEVALRNTDGTYLPYNAACNITTQAFPTSEIILSQCELTATNNTQMIAAVVISGATNYRFQLTNAALSYTYAIDRPLNTFNLSMFPSLMDGTTYTVRVAVMINGVWGPLTGKPCSVTTPGMTPRPATVTKIETEIAFSAIAYPNPFAENFMFDVKTAAQNDIQIRVYDMLGKQVENRNVKATEINNVKFGDSYPSGVYNIIVSQGENTKTIRLIKR